MIIVAVVQPIAVSFIGWMAITMHKLNREVGELKQMIISIVESARNESQSINRRFDDKKNKD